MRASKYMLPLYGAMVGTPIVLFLRLLALVYYPSGVIVYILTILTALGLITFGAFAYVEVFVHDYPESVTLPLVEGKRYAAPGARAEEADATRVTFRVKRFNEEKKQIEEVAYKQDVDKFTTVLGALIDVKERQDPTLSMRYSCRMGICGSCGMVVNGKPSLVCETNVLDNAKEGEITVEPMQGHPLLRDLVTDFDDFFEKHMSVEPRLYRVDAKEQYAAKKEYKQSTEQVDKFLPYSYCIMCGLCEDACPVVNTNPKFIGPQALSQTYRYYKDSRDQKGAKRLLGVDSLEGAWGCEFAGACSKVCPKGVDPAAAIQLLKSDLMAGALKDKDNTVK